MAKAAGLYRGPLLNPQPDLSLPPLLENGQSRMTIPLLRGSEELGIIIVESPIAGAFDGQDLLAMTALADHAVTALETARQFDQIRQERSRADLIIRTMADGLMSLDPDGQVMVMNAAAETLTGWPANRGVGRPICEVLECRGSNNCGDNCRLRTALRDRQALHEDRWITHMPEGTARVLELNATPLLANDVGGSHAGAVLVLRDVTDRDALERFQRDLVASVSHEMRAPLANIQAVADLLLQTGGTPEFTLHEGLETIQAQTRRLADFAERTLDVSRLEMGAWQMEPRPLPVALLVKAAVREWQTAHPARSIALELPSESLWAWADEQSVSLVLSNLLSNAIKYSPEKAAITVSMAQGPEGFITLAVADQGPGIPPEQQIQSFRAVLQGRRQRLAADVRLRLGAATSPGCWSKPWVDASVWPVSPASAVASRSRCRSIMRQTGKHRAGPLPGGPEVVPGVRTGENRPISVARRGRNARRLLQMEMDT